MKENQITERWIAARYIRKNGAIIDFTDRYEVSSLGRVKSLNYRGTKKAKVLNQYIWTGSDGNIMYTVRLWVDNKSYSLKVHRLVLSSFDPKGFKPGNIVNHKVERTATSCINELSNLEWISLKDNVNTEHCVNAHVTYMKGRLMNRKDQSKPIRVTNFTTGETTIYPSSHEAARALGLNLGTPAYYIKHNGYYKKLNLHFAYV